MQEVATGSAGGGAVRLVVSALGGTQRTVQEMIDEEEKAGGERLTF